MAVRSGFIAKKQWDASRLCSVADILQEPRSWDFASQAARGGEFIDLTSYSMKLRALDVAALREGNLIGGSAPGASAGDEIGKAHRATRNLYPVAALGVAIPILRPRDGVGDVFVLEPELGQSDRRRRVSEPQRDVDAFIGACVGTAADAGDMGARFKPVAKQDRPLGVGAAGDNVGAGAGVLLPHTEVELTNRDPRTYEYNYAGPAGQALIGLEVRLLRMSVFIEYKFTYAQYEAPLSQMNGSWMFLDLWRQLKRWINGEEPPGGHVSTQLASHQLVGGLAVRFATLPEAP